MSAEARTLPGRAGAASTRYLHIWLLFVLFIEYARPLNYIPGVRSLPINSFAPLVLLVVVMFVRGLREGREIFSDALSGWIVAYFGFVLFSMTYAEITMNAFNVVNTAAGYLILWFIMMRVVTTTQRVRGVFAVLIAAHVFLLIMNPAAVLSPETRHYIQGGTFLGDGNDFALSLCILLPMAIELALSATTRPRRILCWAVLLLLALGIIGSSSRGGTLGMAAIAVYLWLRSPRKGLTLVITLVGVVGILAYAPDLYFKRMSTLSNVQEDGSAMGRVEAWKQGARMFAANPVFGAGAGNFPNAAVRYRSPDDPGGRWHNAHSMYFQVLGELGLCGIVCVLVLVIANMRANTRLRKLLLPAAGAGPPAARPLAAARPARGRPTTKATKEIEAKPAQPVLNATRLLYMLNASMLGFAVSGAFLSVAYYPHFFVLTALMASVRCMVRNEFGLVPVGPRPGSWRRASTRPPPANQPG